MLHVKAKYLCHLFIAASLLGMSCNKKTITQVEKPAWEIAGWQLIWHDEFDGPQIDLSKWGHEVNAQGGGNNELQYYTARPENSFIQDGVLVIRALQENYTGPEGTRAYTSARLRTLNKGDWKYGRFDIRAKLPVGRGMWPAIWMLPTDWVYGGWAASGEIDIMEMLGHDIKTVHGTLHYGAAWPGNIHTGKSFTLPQGDFTNEFHTFRLDWTENEFKWYVDDQLYQTQTQWHTTGHPYPAPFNQRFHMLLNLAVGGNWPGNPDASTVFPQTLTVDYVRVYQRAP